MKKHLIKKTCKSCGNAIIVEKRKFGLTPAPKTCSTCRTIGIIKAKEELHLIKSKLK